MVNSDLMFEFVKALSGPRVHIKEDGTDYVEVFLGNEDLVGALGVVAKVVEIETAAELSREHLAAHTRSEGNFGQLPGAILPVN